MKWLRRTSLALLTILVLGTAWLAWSYRALAAAVCARCAGMDRVSSTLVVESGMAMPTRAQLVHTRDEASERVAEWFGATSKAMNSAVIVACATEACDRRLGGRGARGQTLTTPLLVAIRLSPRGLDGTIVAHELAHVAIHERAGLERARTGAFPAWFDEGLAVIISGDDRYVVNGKAARCNDASLPTNPFKWASASGSDPMIYADAACRVLGWLEENDGRNGLLRAFETGEALP